MKKFKKIFEPFINKVNRLLNSDTTNYTLSDLPKPLYKYIIKQLYTAPFILLLGIIAAIITKDIIVIPLTIAICLLCLYHGLSLIRDCYADRIGCIRAVMYEDYDSERHGLIFKSRRYILLLCPDKTYLKVFAPSSFTPEAGNEIEVYGYRDSFRKINDDTILASNYITLQITKNTSDLEFTNEESADSITEV